MFMIRPPHRPPSIEARNHCDDGSASWRLISRVKPRTTFGEKELAIPDPSTAKLKRGYKRRTNDPWGRWFIRKRTGKTRIPTVNAVDAITSREKSTIQRVPLFAYSTGSSRMDENGSGRISRRKTQVETNAMA